MIKLGEIQNLTVMEITDHGLMLGDIKPAFDPNDRALLSEETILLPKNQSKGYKLGDKVNVFVYRDSEDRPVATTAEPLITLNKVARLKVKEVTKIGAFLDWGLTKDLLLPFREQTKKVEKNDEVLVALYIDKTGRLSSTMKIYHYLLPNSPYAADDRVEGTVYEVSGNFGTFVAVDDIYSALIPKNELFHPIPIGARIECRVVKVTDDGRLTLSTREKIHLQMDADARLVLLSLHAAGGFIPLGDKSSPEAIKARFGLSKAAYKRAIGALYRAREISIDEDGIREIPKD